MGTVKKFDLKALKRPRPRKPVDIQNFEKMGKRDERLDIFSSQLKDVSALLREILTELSIITRMVMPMGGYFARSVALVAAGPPVKIYDSPQPRVIYLQNPNAVQVPPAADILIYINSTNAVGSTNGWILGPRQSEKFFMKENTEIWAIPTADTNIRILELY